MNVMEVLGTTAVVVGVLFFLAGSIGLLRFPDVYARLHALGKAENLGLGFVALGLALQVDRVSKAFLMVLTWLLVLSSSTVTGHLVARSAWRASSRQGKPGSSS